MIGFVDVAGRERCKYMERQIRRHCDGIEEIKIYPEKALEVCEHCKAPWTGSGDRYNGGCCTKDEESNPLPLLGPGTQAQQQENA